MRQNAVTTASETHSAGKIASAHLLCGCCHDVIGCRGGDPLQVADLGLLADAPEGPTVLRLQHCNGGTTLARAAGAPAPVQEGLCVLGQVIMDHLQSSKASSDSTSQWRNSSKVKIRGGFMKERLVSHMTAPLRFCNEPGPRSLKLSSICSSIWACRFSLPTTHAAYLLRDRACCDRPMTPSCPQ